jgi:methionine-R-sulfoxide reductase
MEKTEEEWRKDLTSEEYAVLREHATEAPFSGKYLEHNDHGVYRCKACKNILFTSEKKLNSNEGDPGLHGWPSFSDVAQQGAVGTRPDDSFGMHRTEVYCKKCDGHLGHVFDEKINIAVQKHYCINSVSLDFEKQ